MINVLEKRRPQNTNTYVVDHNAQKIQWPNENG